MDELTHDDKRVNIPTADAHDFVDAAAAASSKLRYERDPSLDPQLVWKGKDAGVRGPVMHPGSKTRAS